ncbi:MAG TPA: hypothetical protein V6D29_08090 [Leptolyngbyaceae cyanobacterium]
MAYLPRLSSVLVGVAAASGLLAVAPALAQNNQNSSTGTASMLDPNAGYTSPDGGSDLFSDPMAPMDLIHRAVLMNDMSLAEFRQRQQAQISDEAANFRQRQQEALRQQPTQAGQSTDAEAVNGTP